MSYKQHSPIPVSEGGTGGAAIISTVAGNSGTATGTTITLSGGSSGAVFTASGSTVTESFNNLVLPVTGDGPVGVISLGDPFVHAYAGGLASNNAFVGYNAGNFTMDEGFATDNTGIGTSCLGALTEGTNNTCIGSGSGRSITDGTWNTSIGSSSFTAANSAINNTAVGIFALQSLTIGQANSALGANSAVNYTGNETNNICINSRGVAGESNVTRIGIDGGGGTVTNCLIGGIFGSTVTGSAVLCNSGGLLGTVVSSERYKQDIVDLGNESSDVMKLRPVSFAYKSSPTAVRSSGLIAEEVDKIMPRLVVRDKEGLPESVMYHELSVLLLNEMKKMATRIEVLEAKLK